MVGSPFGEDISLLITLNLNNAAKIPLLRPAIFLAGQRTGLQFAHDSVGHSQNERIPRGNVHLTV